MTNTTQAEEQILKTDVLERVKMPKARREELLDEFERSGLTGQKFAAVVGIKYQTFATWVQKRRGQRGADPAVKTPRQLRWLEAVAEQVQKTGGESSLALVLELPGGTKVQISDAKQAGLAAELLRALQSSCQRPPC